MAETYRQLFRIFEALENAHFSHSIDFGENIAGCFQWFIAPDAVGYLEKCDFDFWKALKQNKKILFKLETWQGCKTESASIALK